MMLNIRLQFLTIYSISHCATLLKNPHYKDSSHVLTENILRNNAPLEENDKPYL